MRMKINAELYRNQSYNRLPLIASLTLLFLVGSLVIPGVPTGSGAEEWQVGDSWAMGYQEDLNFDFDYEEFLRSIVGDEFDVEEEELEEFTVTSEGTMGTYIISEVVETSPQIKVKTTTSFGIDWKGNMKVVGDFYKAGHYEDVVEGDDGDWDIPKERKTVIFALECDFALIANGFEYRNAETLAIEKITYEMEWAGIANFKFTNMINEEEGDWDYDSENDQEIIETFDVTYHDFSYDFSSDAEATITSEYSPGIQSQPPSETIGDVWNQTYTVTTSGTYDGFLKAHVNGDVPDMDEEIPSYGREDFDDPSFSYPPFVEGEIQETTEQVTLRHEIVGKESVTLGDGSTVECIVYKEGGLVDDDDDYRGETRSDDDDDDYGDDEEAEMFYFYSPTHQRIVKFQSEYDVDDELFSEIPYSSMSMTSVTVDTAETFNDDYANPANVGKSSEVESSQNLYLYSGAAFAIILIGIGAFVMVRKRSSEDSGSMDAFNQSAQPMGDQGYPPSPGAFQQPLNSAYNAPQTGYQTGTQSTQCPTCNGAAAYYPNYNQYYCATCQRAVPAPVQQTMAPSMNQGYGAVNQWQTPQIQGVQQQYPQQQPQVPYQQQQQPAATAAQMQAKQFCNQCGGHILFSPQYNRNYCANCQTFR